jgi:hypothetical protein
MDQSSKFLSAMRTFQKAVYANKGAEEGAESISNKKHQFELNK